MSADVLDFSSHRRRPEPTVSRCTCRPGWVCYPHQVERVVIRLRQHRMAQGAELLVPIHRFDAVLAEAVDALADIVADSLDERRAEQ